MLTYADLLASPRYAAAAGFFLDDLYGPQDFTERDTQFARVVPGLARLFPRELLLTVLELAELHALSEQLDTEMARALDTDRIDGPAYAKAWRHVGQPERRERQVELMLAVGFALDRYTRNLLLRKALRLMRGPAHAAGNGKLQEFLENGFDTFRALGGAKSFLDTIAGREHEIWDLGAAWFELTGLPFVYAVWALRRGVENHALRQQLREAKDFGLDTLDSLIRNRTEYTFDFRKDYFGWHIHYHLGSDEKRGIAKFMELLRKHGFGPLYEPKFVF